MIEKSESAVFEHLSYVLPLLNDLLVGDVAVAFTDRGKYLFAKPGRKFDFPVHPGMMLKPGTSVVRAMEEKKRISIRGDKSTFGIPYFATSLPIVDNAGEVIGSVVVVETVEKQEEVRVMAADLTKAINALAGTSQEISAQAEEIAGVSQELVTVACESLARVQKTSQVVDLIKGIASEINLLGLNAAIESARVGERGRGFGVVAQEIRKLGDSTVNSIKQIDQIISSIQADSEYNKRQLEHVVQAIFPIANAVSQSADIIQSTCLLANRLNEMAEDMTRSDL